MQARFLPGALGALLLMLPSATAQARPTTPTDDWSGRPSALRLNAGAFADRLSTATAADPAVVAVPNPNGGLDRFRVVPTRAMAAGPARAASEFHGYTGTGVDDPSATVVLDHSIIGAHASVRSADGAYYVDPAKSGSTYRSYFLADAKRTGPAPDERGPVGSAPKERKGSSALPTPGAAVIRRDYRLALATDPSYATALSTAGDDAATVDAKVTAAKQTLISRVNQLYNDDMAIHFTLVANNNLLNYNTPAAFLAAYGNDVTSCDSNNSAALAQNQSVVDAVIGSADYDIGHLAFGPDGDGGGIAGLGVVGQDGDKAQGCTGLAVPFGDWFAIDFVAHEFGHQFSGNHTFNGTTGSCVGTRRKDHSVEPGSGSSIMSYAGLCHDSNGYDDVQAHSDPYFSQHTIQEMQTFVTGTPGAGGTETTTTNHSPVVTVPAGRTIPIRTPFTLTGSAADADGNALVYLWEQNDPGAASATGTLLTDNTKPLGALFRVFSFRSTETDTDAGQSPAPGQNLANAAGATRTFPDLTQILAGNTNAATGACPDAGLTPTPEQIDCYSEFLPTAGYTGPMHFRLTARDLFATGGGVSSGDVTIGVSGSQPFRVTSQAAAANLTGNTSVPVTWDVAGTNAGPFDVSNVRISFSADGGKTFPTEVLASTPNDGNQSVTVPNVATTTGRFKVEAVGNYFFDISDANVTVAQGAAVTATPTYTIPSPSPTPSASPQPGAVRASVSGTAKKPRVRKRKAAVKVRCDQVTAGQLTTCSGRVTLVAKIKGKRRTIAGKAFSVAAGDEATIRVKISRKAARVIRLRGRLKAKVTATVGADTASKKITLRPAG